MAKPKVAHKVTLIGGPLDGEVADVAAPRAFLWFDMEGDGANIHSPGRYLYRCNGRRWYFAGHGARECDGCGSVLMPDPTTAKPLIECPLCGAP